MLYKLLYRIHQFINQHEATKGRPKLFQSIVLLIVIIILAFIIRSIGSWIPFRA